MNLKVVALPTHQIRLDGDPRLLVKIENALYTKGYVRDITDRQQTGLTLILDLLADKQSVVDFIKREYM